MPGEKSVKVIDIDVKMNADQKGVELRISPTPENRQRVARMAPNHSA